MWTKIEDRKVRMIWECKNALCEEDLDERKADVYPSFYQANGIPMCMCGEDMDFIETQVEKIK